MKLLLKPLGEQVMVIAGAASSITMAIARDAAARGARVVLAAAQPANLEDVIREIRGRGGRAIAVRADPMDQAEAHEIASIAVAEFGRIDTWVAAGRGYRFGARAALTHIRRTGGAIVILSGEASAQTFKDRLRREIDAAGAPVLVTVLSPRSSGPRAVLRAAQHPLRTLARAR
jgi:NAD(P)-dependent dehydrogenase (short-subunit alcohol dehydrogenase family)